MEFWLVCWSILSHSADVSLFQHSAGVLMFPGPPPVPLMLKVCLHLYNIAKTIQNIYIYICMYTYVHTGSYGFLRLVFNFGEFLDWKCQSCSRVYSRLLNWAGAEVAAQAQGGVLVGGETFDLQTATEVCHSFTILLLSAFFLNCLEKESHIFVYEWWEIVATNL